MKKLTQSTTDKKIWGVAGGVAEYFGINSWIVRLSIIIIALIISDPITIGILYAIIALVLDTDEEQQRTELIAIEEYEVIS